MLNGSRETSNVALPANCLTSLAFAASFLTTARSWDGISQRVPDEGAAALSVFSSPLPPLYVRSLPVRGNQQGSLLKSRVSGKPPINLSPYFTARDKHAFAVITSKVRSVHPLGVLHCRDRRKHLLDSRRKRKALVRE